MTCVSYKHCVTRFRYDISNRQDMRYDYELRDLTNMEKRTAMIKRILHVVTLQKESDPFRAFVEQPTPQHRSTCLQRLDELIAYCSQFSPLYMKDANRASTAHLENELVVHGWNSSPSRDDKGRKEGEQGTQQAVNT